MNNDKFWLCKFSKRPALPQKIGNQQIPRFLPRWRWLRDPVLLLDVAVLCRMDARDVSSRWISACWISTSQCWFWSSLAGRCFPQMINQFMKTPVPRIDKHWQAAPTKITTLTWKSRNKSKKKTRKIAADWRAWASLPATRTLRRLPLRTSAPVVVVVVQNYYQSTSAASLSRLGYHIWSGGDHGQGSYHWAIGRNSYCHSPFTSWIHLGNGPAAARWLLILLIW